METFMEQTTFNKKYINISGFTLCQQNGQRTYGGPPPGWGNRPAPNRDSEVFIGRLPRMCFEDELIPLFSGMGELYEFRLMLDFSGTNRGYAYAHYTTPEGAMKAIKFLNKYEIRPGHLIGVLKSKNNCRLLFGNIQAGVKFEDFSEFIRSATEQVLNVIMFDEFDELKNTEYRISPEVGEAFLGRVTNPKGKFAIVEYETHKAAAVARRVLIPKYGHKLAIDWAVPPRERKLFNYAAGNNRKMTPRNGVIAQNPFPPVPLLIIKPSITNNVKMLSKTFTITLAFFKNVLKVCVSATVFQLNLPQLMLQEIQKKIIDRISNVENCGEGIQLIINYFVALTDDKPDFFVQEVMVVFRQVKSFAYLFLEFMWRKALSGRRDEDVKIDKYFCKILPFKLILLYDIILFYSKENPFRFVMNFSKGLSWLDGLLRTGAQDTKTFLSKMNRFVVHLDPESRETVMKITQKLITEILNANISIDFMNEGGSF